MAYKILENILGKVKQLSKIRQGPLCKGDSALRLCLQPILRFH